MSIKILEKIRKVRYNEISFIVLIRKYEKMEKGKLKIYQIFWYFVLFSIIGLIIETLYGFITMGVLESRKGLIWGPFCPVYGVGAVILIVLLNQVDPKNYFKLFTYGFFIGATAEYLMSYVLEAFYGIRFWDYTYTGKDINGRICTLYSLFWGILAIFLMKFMKPNIDKLIAKIPRKVGKILEIGLLVFLIIDALVTIWAVHTYETRAIQTYYQEEKQVVDNQNWFIQIKNKIENEYFTNERMKKTFPNLRTKDRQGNEVWVRDLIQTQAP